MFYFLTYEHKLTCSAESCSYSHDSTVYRSRRHRQCVSHANTSSLYLRIYSVLLTFLFRHGVCFISHPGSCTIRQTVCKSDPVVEITRQYCNEAISRNTNTLIYYLHLSKKSPHQELHITVHIITYLQTVLHLFTCIVPSCIVVRCSVVLYVCFVHLSRSFVFSSFCPCNRFHL